MSKKNNSRRFFSTAAKILILMAVCLLFSFILVFPLCKWCQFNSLSYTVFILFLFASYIVYLCVRKIKKSGWFSFLKVFVPVFEAVVLCLISFFLISNYMIYSGLILFVLTFVFLGLIIWAFNRMEQKRNKVKSQED